ncbi:hypothetical protein ACH4D4_10280 [Streptomyces pristinaespiralis]|jgi:hypothetical protein|uniref:hypothetical protein n=1 Tax=Streptomyces pristinaespiralis TaxID=38300 RepID=UPI0037AE3B95
MPARTGALRPLAAIAVAAAAVPALVACEPTAGGLNTGAVAVTTDRTVTSTLERLEFEVGWLSCTAKADTPATASSGSTAPSAAGPSRASVDCQGETGSGQDITVTGKVTEERGGKCVRGDLTARIEKKIVFRATMLGDCSAAPSSAPAGDPPAPGTPYPTVTVTVTETVTAQAK